MRMNIRSGRHQIVALLLCFLLSPWAAMAQDIGRPGIKILVAPPSGGDPNRTETIKGEATGVKFDEYRVALFSYADGRWWPQPFLNNQQTRLDDEGKFATQIHPGIRYAAALVSSSFPPQPAEMFDLPNVGGDVLLEQDFERQKTTEPPPTLLDFKGVRARLLWVTYKDKRWSRMESHWRQYFQQCGATEVTMLDSGRSTPATAIEPSSVPRQVPDWRGK